ncbi:MAG: hypothetical protein HY749_16200 [Gammaproteobacteria bacterium]|nr:hypothetical protein [Gammaproteobacteria bacterium]
MANPLKARAEALGSNLVEAFQSVVEADGHSLGDVLQAINARLGSSYDHARFGQWRRGERPVPERFQRIMRQVVIDFLFPSGGATSALTAVLSPP